MMMRSFLLIVCLALSAGAAAPGTAQVVAPAIPCEALTSLVLPDVRITEAAAVAPAAPPADGLTRPHCRVDGVIGREIRFEVLLPEVWNQRFVMGGGGGFVGTVQNGARWTADLGYATAGTDTGHQGSGIDASWALNHPERQVNFGHLAVHRTAEVAKAILRAYYGAAASFSYFMGCSRGGGQALIEAQRYPADFDGIVAAAPALDWTGFAAEMIQNVQRSFPDLTDVAAGIVTDANLQLLETYVLAACDALDGVQDGVMEDPRACPFDLARIPACVGDRPAADCFTRAQRAAIEAVYAPATRADGSVILPGQPFGGEGHAQGWRSWITGPNESLLRGTDGRVPSLQWAFGTEIARYFVFGDPGWNYTTYDFSTWDEDAAYAAALLNATDPDLSAFRDRRGRLILWHGWSDPALSALASIRYYEQVEALDPDVRSYFRMFLAPGVLHCGGGPGPDQADWLAAIVDWVERGRAPARIVATKKAEDGAVLRTRPLCPYPQRAVYTGSGSTDAAEHFVCRVP